MKIKTYRILFLLTLFGLALYAIYSIYDCLLVLFAAEEDVTNTIVDLLCFIILLFIYIFEILTIIKSFSNGTLLLNGFMFRRDGKSRNKITLTLASIAFTFGLFITIFFLLSIVRINPYLNGLLIPIEVNLTFSFGLLLLVNSLFMLLYSFLFMDESKIL